MKRLTRVLAALPLLAVMTLGLPAAASALSLRVPTTVVATTPQQAICNGVGLSNASGSCGDNGLQIGNVLGAVINLLTTIVGVAAVIMIIISGLRFITSGGDSSKVASAKSALIYAIIGVVVVVLAQTIVHFVIVKI